MFSRRSVSLSLSVGVSLSPVCENTLDRQQETDKDTREDRELQLLNTHHVSLDSFVCSCVLMSLALDFWQVCL